VRASAARKGAFLVVAVSLLLAALMLVPDHENSPLAAAERFAFDIQMRVLRDIDPRPDAGEVVLVAADEETYRRYDEPFALWHLHFADVMHALARAQPRAVGIDFVLPQVSYERNLPGGDAALVAGLTDLRGATKLVNVQAADGQGRQLPLQPAYRTLMPPENLALARVASDADAVPRRFAPDESGTAAAPTLVGQILRQLGRPAESGFIDYSLGAPLTYVPMHDIAAWDAQRLRAAFAGRIVLVGNLAHAADRVRLPVRLLMTDPGLRSRASNDASSYVQPTLLVHAQTLRSALGAGLLQPVSGTVLSLLLLLATATALLHARAAALVAAAVLVPILLLAASLVAIVTQQVLLPVASLCAAFWLALAARGIFDASEAVVERVRLHRSFAGQVSPAVMKEMLAGNMSAGIHGQLAEVCVLFSDIRDFTTLSEHMTPDLVTSVLQRYFDGMVKAVHRFDGTVDKFIGDGMMVLFGAPQKLADPCGQAVQCALAMMASLDALNEEFRAEGLPVLTIGIGINHGVVTVGNIGSSERHNYSAIGDAVNVAARVEGLTKSLPRKILITDAVVDRLQGRFHFEAQGTHDVKGHTPVRVYGIRTRPLEASAAVAPPMETARSA
jgi:adenylate cyclase